MTKEKFECGLGFHEYTIPDKNYSFILICKHCKRYGYYKNSKGFEYWTEYDENGNMIHFKNGGNGFECWNEYDNKGNIIHYKDNTGYESWLYKGKWVTKKSKNWEYGNEQVNL